MAINLMQGALAAVILQPRKLPGNKLLAASAMAAALPGLPGMLLPLLLVKNVRGGATTTNGNGNGNGTSTTVPKVTGLAAPDAVYLLNSAGLQAEFLHDNRRNHGDNYVHQQVPRPGETVEIDSTVELVVDADRATEIPIVPDVQGDGVDDAVKRLALLGLNPEVCDVSVDGKCVGAVVSQIPKGGKHAGKDRKVTLFVQQSSEQVASWAGPEERC
jgi:beta-lactam-binding protein with PASTA domain